MQKAILDKIALIICVQLLCMTHDCLAQLHIGSGTTWVSNPATTVVLNDLSLQYDAGPVLLNNTFRFSGTRNSSISGNSAAKVYAISMAKTSPALLSLNQSLNITKRINFESGLFDLNGNAINLSPTALLTNENESSRIIGPAAGGYISIDANISVAGGAVNPGNLGAYIKTAVDLGMTNIARGHDRQHVTDTAMGIARWYELSVPDIVEPSSTLRFYYLQAETAGLKADSLELWKGYDGVGWTNLGYTSRSTTEKYVERQLLTSLHRFTLFSSPDTTTVTPPPPPPPTAVPGIVTLAAASWAGNDVLLSWTVTKENNNDHFTVERKYADEADFSPVTSISAKVPGAASDSITNYTYTDSAVNKSRGIISYRIHQVGKGGESTYSNTITITPVSSPPPPTTVPGVVFLFAATWSGNNALLNWTVTKEANNDHFTVERKYADQSDFSPIANIPSKVPGVISDSVTHYTYMDSAVSSTRGIISYRIHQVGKGGESTYSNVVTLTPVTGNTFIRKIYPTVAIAGQLYIQAGNMSLSTMQFHIFDWGGKLLMSGTLPYQSQWLPLAFPGHGIFRLVIRSGTQRFSGTFIK